MDAIRLVTLPRAGRSTIKIWRNTQKINWVVKCNQLYGYEVLPFIVAYNREAPRRNYAQIFIATTSIKAADDMVHEYEKVRGKNLYQMEI